MVEFLATYWLQIVNTILLIILWILLVINEKKNIKEWLLYAVVEAEKGLGSKTGKLKLRQVYDWFISTYPIISKLISFNTFSSYVDMALDEMENILDTNEAIKQYVEGDE
jgi:hypothetical protein